MTPGAPARTPSDVPPLATWGSDERPPDTHSHARPARLTPARRLRTDARHPPGDARRTDRQHRTAHDRGRSRRPGPLLLVGDGVPAHHGRRHPPLGQARRPLRPQGRLHRLRAALPDRDGAVRPGAEHGAAHRLPGRPGSRRGRPDGRGARGHRCAGAPTGARPHPVDGGRHAAGGVRRRPPARRIHHRLHGLALGFLRQRPHRHRRPAGRRQGHDCPRTASRDGSTTSARAC